MHINAELTDNVNAWSFDGKPFKLLRGTSLTVTFIGKETITVRYFGRFYRISAEDFDKLNDYIEKPFEARLW